MNLKVGGAEDVSTPTFPLLMSASQPNGISVLRIAVDTYYSYKTTGSATANFDLAVTSRREGKISTINVSVPHIDMICSAINTNNIVCVIEGGISMTIRYAVILILLLMLTSCIPADDDSCRRPFFTGNAYFDSYNSKVIRGLYIDLKVLSAELSNIVVRVSLPNEIRIEKIYSFSGGKVISDTGEAIIRSDNNVVTYTFSRSIKEGESISNSIDFNFLSNKWSKPIEVEISHNFKQLVKCVNGGMKDGKYSKRITLNINPKDGKYYELEGLIEGDWVYVGL